MSNRASFAQADGPALKPQQKRTADEPNQDHGFSSRHSPAPYRLHVEGGPQAVPAGSRAPLQEVPCDATGTAVRPPELSVPASGPYTVEKVVDGDTFRISCNGTSTRVRLLGINAPESVKEDAPVECGGPEASSYLHSLLDGGQVFLSADPAQGAKDKYDRILAYVWTLDGALVNRAVLEKGHAEATGYGKPFAYSDEFTAASDQAKASKAARWNC